MPDEKRLVCRGAGIVYLGDCGSVDIFGEFGRKKDSEIVRCIKCEGTGKVRLLASHFDSLHSTLREFTEFLEDCGGFAIW